MRRISIVLLSTLLVVLVFAGVSMAEGPDPVDPTPTTSIDTELPEALSCSKMSDPDLAHFFVSNGESRLAKKCYNELDLETKARVFEAIVEYTGGSVEDLYKDAEQVMQAPIQASLRAQYGINWRQAIENGGWMPWPAYYGPYTWYEDPWCDGVNDGMDYTFAYWFSPPVQNPDNLRTRSNPYNVSVQLMLDWYQWRYGGITGWGNTGISYVRLCIGDSGVNGAGGPGAIMSSLKLTGFGLW